jgi:hypothetical protein
MHRIWLDRKNAPLLCVLTNPCFALSGRFASVTALVATAGMALISLGGPAWQLARAVPTSNVSVVSAFQTILQTAPSVMRQMALAVTGSTMVLRRSWQVYRTEGNDPKVVDKAVDEGLIAVVVLLASFV